VTKQEKAHQGKRKWAENPNFEIVVGRESMGGRCDTFCPYGSVTKAYVGSFVCRNECEYNRGTTETPGRVTVKCAFKAAHQPPRARREAVTTSDTCTHWHNGGKPSHVPKTCQNKGDCQLKNHGVCSTSGKATWCGLAMRGRGK